MAERDTDIEFDFFDEPETREEPAPRRRRGGPRRPIRPPSTVTPLLRLVGLVVFAILLVVLLVVWVRSCRGASERESYENYMTEVSALAASSEDIGGDLTRALATPGARLQRLQPLLLGLAQRQRQDVTRAQDVEAPGPLRRHHEEVVEALQLRVSGLNGLADAFRRTARSPNLPGAGTLLATQSQRLVASDVVWDDLFKDPARSELSRRGVRGVAVPDSNFVRDANVASAASWRPVLQRLRGTPGTQTAGGIRGNGIVSVVALPARQQLTGDDENTIRADQDLAFEVTVENSGGQQEVNVPVRLRIEQRRPIVEMQRIREINPGESETLVFRNLPAVDVGLPTTLRVEVEPVPGERTTTNNTAVYRVFFSLTSR